MLSLRTGSESTMFSQTTRIFSIASDFIASDSLE